MCMASGRLPAASGRASEQDLRKTTGMCAPWGEVQAKVKAKANVTCLGGFVWFFVLLYVQTEESRGDMEWVL